MAFGILGNSNNIFSSFVNAAALGTAIFTGGASLVASQAITQVATQAFSRAVANVFGQALASTIGSVFQQAFTQTIGNIVGQAVGGAAQQVIDDVLSAANRGPSGNFTGDLDRAQNDMSRALQEALQFVSEQESRRRQASGGGGRQQGGNWLEALARSLGEDLGRVAGDMVKASQDMQGLKTGNKASDAQKFMKAQTEFQVQAQMFNILSQTISTALKSIGEGMAGVARKQ